MARKADWSRPLPRALDFAGLLTISTTSDVRLLVTRHLPESHRDRPHWRALADTIAEAARLGDVQEIEAALWLAAAIEGLSCRPRSERSSRRQSVPRRRGTKSHAGRK